jgi:hypothetical protein
LRHTDKNALLRIAYSHQKKYDGRRIDFQELGPWILSNKICDNYIKMWEDEDEAEIEYLLNRTDANWAAFTTKI